MDDNGNYVIKESQYDISSAIRKESDFSAFDGDDENTFGSPPKID